MGISRWAWLLLSMSICSIYVFLQTQNSYYVCDDPLVIDQIFARIRNYDGQVRFRFWTPSRGMLISFISGFE